MVQLTEEDARLHEGDRERRYFLDILDFSLPALTCADLPSAMMLLGLLMSLPFLLDNLFDRRQETFCLCPQEVKG